MIHKWEWEAIPTRGMSRGIIVFQRKELGLITLVALSCSILHLAISLNSLGDGFYLLFTIRRCFQSKFGCGTSFPSSWDSVFLGSWLDVSTPLFQRWNTRDGVSTTMQLSPTFLMILSVLIIYLIWGSRVLLLLGATGSRVVPGGGPTWTDSLRIWIGWVSLHLILFCIFSAFHQTMLLLFLKSVYTLISKIKFFVLKIFGWSIKVVMIRWLMPGGLILIHPLFMRSPTFLLVPSINLFPRELQACSF